MIEKDFFVFLKERQRDLKNAERHKNIQVEIDNFPFGLGQCIYIHNFQEQKVMYQKGVFELLGYEESEFKSELIHTYFHPDDYEIMNRLLQAIITYASNTDFRNNQCYFYVAYRIRKKNGEYIKVMRQSYVYEITVDGTMISNLSIITDISAIDKSQAVSWDFKSNQLNIEEFKKVVGKQYLDFFSDREKEVIQHLVNGMTSKEIAQKIFISSHTVDTHRRKILKKSNCKNSVELLSFCHKNGIL